MSATSPEGVLGERRLTPMLKQFMDAKAEAPEGAILLFRMGDFYETFFEDARIAARELDIVLTSRDKASDDPIPMAGVPHHAISGYVARLVERGYSVAICDQLEDPRLAKGIVKRAITRLITPGTVSDLEALDPGSATYLASVRAAPDGYVLGLLDLLAGEVLCTRLPSWALADELHRMGVRELLALESERAAVESGTAGMSLPVRFEEPSGEPGESAWSTWFAGLAVTEPFLDGSLERAVVDTVVRFAERTQRRTLRHLMPPRVYRISEFLQIDEASRRNLELTQTTLDGKRKGSLLWHLDRCRTALGSRALHHWLLFPLRDAQAIERRLTAVEGFKGERGLRDATQKALEGVRDVERLLGRVAVGRASPRDLGALRASLVQVPALKEKLAAHPSYLGEAWRQLDEAAELRELLSRALVDDPPIVVNEGGIFAKGYRRDLDELIALSTEGHGFLADLERRERERTGIGNLKVRYNRVFGYYIEITKANLGQVPSDYIRKQTLVGAERYITPELKTFEEKVLTADERRRVREQALFEELLVDVAEHAPALRAISRLIGETDALASLGQVADEQRYVRPTLVPEPIIELGDCRHPVLERLLPGGERFVANDAALDADSRQLLVVTGPNMAGKSTIMRQVALVTLMSHMGSFVPAKKARIGLCDRLFTRVGASDNLSRGHSTFMVEMLETAAILRHATRASLVLLDEIGRGTSTFDGVSIAWAIAEHIHDRVGCRTMFATHYHELTDLARERPRIVNVSVAVKEHDGKVVFLRKLVEGGANRSYGIQVARLAGLPETVLARAREILANLESGELDAHGMPTLAASARQAASPPQMSLFAAPARAEAAPTPSLVERELSTLDPLHMTPMQALAALERLKGLLA